jgi:hypothetical protein
MKIYFKSLTKKTGNLANTLVMFVYMYVVSDMVVYFWKGEAVAKKAMRKVWIN